MANLWERIRAGLLLLQRILDKLKQLFGVNSSGGNKP